jgi:hypothetical protein
MTVIDWFERSFGRDEHGIEGKIADHAWAWQAQYQGENKRTRTDAGRGDRAYL